MDCGSYDFKGEGNSFPRAYLKTTWKGKGEQF